MSGTIDKSEEKSRSSPLNERDLARTERDSVIVERNSARKDVADLKAEAKATKLDTENDQAAREHFIATVSHDLRNPIGAIKMAIEVLRRSEVKHEDLMALIERNCDQAEGLLNHLLDAHLIKSGSKLPIKAERCDLLKILRKCREAFPQDQCEKITLDFKDNEEICGVWDAQALERAFKNLINNAIKFGDTEKEIKVMATQNEETTSVCFQNFGEPISEQNLLRIFDTHFREQNKDMKKGWGLGLTIVRGIAEAHNGQVEVQSSQTEGTIFTLKLPNAVKSGEPLATPLSH